MAIRICLAVLLGLALLLGASTPAAAQSDSQQGQGDKQQQQQSSKQLSGGNDNMSGKDQALMESDEASGKNKSKDQNQDQSQSTQGGQSSSFITAQKSSQILASWFIGMTIKNSADKKAQEIGTVNDLIMNEQQQVVGVVVGVGGFLGIGEKNVGIPWDAVKNVDPEKGIAVISVTKKQLQNAPSFKSKQEQKQEQKQKQMQQQKQQQMKQQSPMTQSSGG